MLTIFFPEKMTTIEASFTLFDLFSLLVNIILTLVRFAVVLIYVIKRSNLLEHFGLLLPIGANNFVLI